MSLANNNNELILNWTNTLRGAPAGERMVIAAKAEDFHKRGYSKQETIDVLLADGYNRQEIMHVAGSIYNDGQQPVKLIKHAMVTPTSYNDVAPIIEDTLAKLGAEGFINALALSKKPILKTSKKGLLSWYRMAERVSDHHSSPDMLHAELEPYICEAMYQSVCLAEKQKCAVKRIAGTDGLYLVESNNEPVVTVDLIDGSSTGERYVGGRFAEFGLADEHLVRVAQLVSPYERLKRAISNS